MQIISNLDRARLALEGLSIGDAFGECFFVGPDRAEEQVAARQIPDGLWRITDDSVMACGVYEILAQMGQVSPDRLSRIFTRNYQKDPARGYGGGAHRLFQEISIDGDWRRHSTNLFGGEGSFGNGGAMRAAPVGAFFADDFAEVVRQADTSALVTHAHPDGRAGAIAIALAAAQAWRCRSQPDGFRATLYDLCLDLTPAGNVRDGIERARNTPASSSVALAVTRLGNGTEISAADTVPLALWAAHRHIDDFTAAMWTTVSALGDRDTTCAIVAGVVALSVGYEGLPPDWIARRESLENWLPRLSG